MKNNTVIVSIILLILLTGLVTLSTKKNSSKINNPNTVISPTNTDNQGVNGETLSPQIQQEISLNILFPVNGQVINSDQITVKGTSVPNAEVNINDIQVIADTQGNFSATVKLDEGENTIIIVANDEKGNTAEQEITITYQM